MNTPEWVQKSVTGIAKFVGNLLGKNKKLVDASKQLNKVVEKGGELVDEGFDVIKWIGSNWQLVVVGFIALLVLLRD